MGSLEQLTMAGTQTTNQQGAQGKPRNANRGNGPRGNNSNKQNAGMEPGQRKALQKIRNVIPKDRASDEELLTMLVDWNQDTDKVIQHFFEAGQSSENEWAVSTNKKDARAAKNAEKRKEHGNEKPRANGAVGQTAAPREKGPSQPRPAPNAPNTRPAPMPADPAPAPAAGSWASRIRAQQPAQPAPLPAPLAEPRLAAPLPMSQDMNGHQDQGNQGLVQFGSYVDEQPGYPMGLPTSAPAPMHPQPGFDMAPAMGQHSQMQEVKHPESNITSATMREGERLQSNSHAASIWASLIKLWDNRELCDLRLKPEPGEMRISVHSVVIAAASPTVSDALIKCHRDGGTPPPELLVHCDCIALEECVRFCYTGELRLSDTSVQNIWYAASVLEIRDVLDLCCSWAHNNIHAGNALLINQLAEQYNIPDLKVSVDRFVLSNLQSLVHEPDFLSQEMTRVSELLSSDDAQFDCELEVFYAVVRWISHNPKERQQYLAQLMATVVRLPQLDFEELEKVELNELVAVDAQAKSLMHDVYRYLAAPEVRRSAMSVPGTRQRNQYNRYC